MIQSAMATAERIDSEVGDERTYNISATSIPYFASYTDFHYRSGQASTRYDDILQFEAAYDGVQIGFHYCFRKLGTDLTEYHALCDTLDFLCADTLDGRSIDAISQGLKSGKGRYGTDYKRSVYVKANKTTARDSSFGLLYLILTAELEDETTICQKIYQAVLFVVSHRAIFNYHARKTITAAYEERFHVSEKQRASLNRWPVLEPGMGAVWSDEDVTAEESSVVGAVSDGSWRPWREIHQGCSLSSPYQAGY